MNDTQTPETDAQMFRAWIWDTHKMDYVPHGVGVPVEFARQLERELAEARNEIIGWREAAYALGEALPPSWETLQPPAEQLRKFKEMVALQNEKTKNLLDIADKHSKMYP
jgi:hypothetical protein